MSRRGNSRRKPDAGDTPRPQSGANPLHGPYWVTLNLYRKAEVHNSMETSQRLCSPGSPWLP